MKIVTNIPIYVVHVEVVFMPLKRQKVNLSQFVKRGVSYTRAYCIRFEALNRNHVCCARLIFNLVEYDKRVSSFSATWLIGLGVKELRNRFLGPGFESRLKFKGKFF